MLLGLDNNYTRGARRLIAFAVAKSSYETAAFQLKEFGCITVSHQTVSNLVPSLSDEVQSKLANNADVRQAFQEAKGDTEFTTDGAFIKIRHEDKSHCWMECKVAGFAKRERGKSALPHEWDSRELPKPTVNMAMATLDKIDEFTERCKEFRFNLGVGGGVSVLGDGAHWIWNLSPKLFGNTAECLDIFHAAEHISGCGKALFKDAEQQRCWFEDTRLFSGRAIGSGVVEGACKNLVGRRLKQTGACWRLRQAEKMTVLCATLYSNQWKYAWKPTYPPPNFYAPLCTLMHPFFHFIS
ncbi:hypothetical protein FACS1894170_13450 [Planctomycetales bacterium]|nr:hypothetical protein FACS1894170_13450 [Planctomycetales bacterium]